MATTGSSVASTSSSNRGFTSLGSYLPGTQIKSTTTTTTTPTKSTTKTNIPTTTGPISNVGSSLFTTPSSSSSSSKQVSTGYVSSGGGPQPSTPSVTTTKPNVYYTSNADWAPTNDKNALVINITSGGITTGKTSAGSSLVPIGLNVREEGRNTLTGQTGNIGSLLASGFSYSAPASSSGGAAGQYYVPGKGTMSIDPSQAGKLPSGATYIAPPGAQPVSAVPSTNALSALTSNLNTIPGLGQVTGKNGGVTIAPMSSVQGASSLQGNSLAFKIPTYDLFSGTYKETSGAQSSMIGQNVPIQANLPFNTEYRTILPSQAPSIKQQGILETNVRGLFGTLAYGGSATDLVGSYEIAKQTPFGIGVESTQAKIAKVSDIATFTTNLATVTSPLGWTTKAATILSSSATRQLFEPPNTNNIIQEKAVPLSQLGITFATEGASSLLFGGAMKFGGKTLTALGSTSIARLESVGGNSLGSQIGIKLAGGGLKAGGYAIEKGTEVYFKTKFISEGINTANLFKEQKYESGKSSLAGLSGGILGFYAGEKIGGSAFNFASGAIAGKYLKVPTETSIKNMPGNIQTEILTEPGKSLVAYRYGYLSSGGLLKPKLDIYSPAGIKNPTEQIFFRYDESIGVGGKTINPSLSIPSFVKDKPYVELFKFNIESFGKQGYRGIGKYARAFAETPLSQSIVVVKQNTMKIDNLFREDIIREQATLGKFTEISSEKIMKSNTLISDKLRERPFAQEQELVLRTPKILEQSKILFTQRKGGEIIPVILEKGIDINVRRTFFFPKESLINQEAKYIERNIGMYERFGGSLVQPKAHAYTHALDVSTNIEKIYKAYPEFGGYFSKKYGTQENALIELKKGGMLHDIGKKEAGSIQFGTQHGQLVYNVWKKGLLPKGYSLTSGVASAIRVHETLNPRKASYKISNALGLITPEQKILATADRMDLGRVGRNVDIKRLPLPDVYNRLNMKEPKGIENTNLGTRNIFKGISSKSMKIKSDYKLDFGKGYYIKSTGDYNILPKSNKYSSINIKTNYSPYSKTSSYYSPTVINSNYYSPAPAKNNYQGYTTTNLKPSGYNTYDYNPKPIITPTDYYKGDTYIPDPYKIKLPSSPGLPWGEMEFSVDELGKVGKSKGRKYKRTSSIAANYFGYKSTTAAPLEIGGFVTRPILVSPRKSKSKRK